MARGTYAENVTVARGVTLLGGWCDGFGDRDPSGGCVSVIDAPGTTAVFVGANGAALEGFEIRSANAMADGASSYAVRVVGAEGVRLEALELRPGNGANGGDGDDGVDGAPGGDGDPGAERDGDVRTPGGAGDGVGRASQVGGWLGSADG